jgi:hypothetical protein|tara:strand:+ start:264 stop:368 length:105 start_codon:yes stop_codon:yes gene_type:complete
LAAVVAIMALPQQPVLAELQAAVIQTTRAVRQEQ